MVTARGQRLMPTTTNRCPSQVHSAAVPGLLLVRGQRGSVLAAGGDETHAVTLVLERLAPYRTTGSGSCAAGALRDVYVVQNGLGPASVSLPAVRRMP